MPRPSVQGLPRALRDLAVEVAERLAPHGARVWIVGGAVRDLALGRAIQDVDLASAATPDVVESEFLRTIPIGRAFGTVVIHLAGRDVEHTTFRSEEGYSDARRPDEVRFGQSLAGDASRRDFRCNALYLDPRTDELADPTGGLEDLAERRLTCVGDPARRFAEDGLRIVRMARFAGQLGLWPTEATLAGARATLDALRGVSPERLRVELEHLCSRGGLAPALAVLQRSGALERVLPLHAGAAQAARLEALLQKLPDPPGLELGFAALLDPALGDPPRLASAAEALLGLHPSRRLLDHVRGTWRLADELERAESAPRSRRIRWMREPCFATACALARARARVRGTEAAGPDALERERAQLADSDLAPPPLVGADDLLAHGLAPGPRYRELLTEAETLQLDLLLTTRADALAWLRRALQDGGNTRRKA